MTPVSLKQPNSGDSATSAPGSSRLDALPTNVVTEQLKELDIRRYDASQPVSGPTNVKKVEIEAFNNQINSNPNELGTLPSVQPILASGVKDAVEKVNLDQFSPMVSESTVKNKTGFLDKIPKFRMFNRGDKSSPSDGLNHGNNKLEVIDSNASTQAQPHVTMSLASAEPPSVSATHSQPQSLNTNSNNIDSNIRTPLVAVQTQSPPVSTALNLAPLPNPTPNHPSALQTPVPFATPPQTPGLPRHDIPPTIPQSHLTPLHNQLLPHLPPHHSPPPLSPHSPLPLHSPFPSAPSYGSANSGPPHPPISPLPLPTPPPPSLQLQQAGLNILGGLPPPEHVPYLRLTAREYEAVHAGLQHQIQIQAQQIQHGHTPTTPLVMAAPKTIDIKRVRERMIAASAPNRHAYVSTIGRAAKDGRLKENCRPSLLQSKLKLKRYRMSSLCSFQPDSGFQSLYDLKFGETDGMLLPNGGGGSGVVGGGGSGTGGTMHGNGGGVSSSDPEIWQFSLALDQVDVVGTTGLRLTRRPRMHIARLALFDRQANRFLGNVAALAPKVLGRRAHRWSFDSNEKLIVRCSSIQPATTRGGGGGGAVRRVSLDDVSILVELNVSYALTTDDASRASLPSTEKKCHGIVDEICTCWALLSLRRCVEMPREVAVAVPLYCGPLFAPAPLEEVRRLRRAKSPVKALFIPLGRPSLRFLTGPISSSLPRPPVVPLFYMPPTQILPVELACAFGAHRMAAALALSKSASGPFASVCDPVLPAFKKIVDDADFFDAWTDKWRAALKQLGVTVETGVLFPRPPAPPPAMSVLVEAFRRCTLEVAPLLHCETVPPPHIDNFDDYAARRRVQVQAFCKHLTSAAAIAAAAQSTTPTKGGLFGAIPGFGNGMSPITATPGGGTPNADLLPDRHPVEPLSLAGFQFLYDAFDASEVRYCVCDDYP